MAPAVLFLDAESFSNVPVIGDGKGGDRIFIIRSSVHFLIVYHPIFLKRKDNLPFAANLPVLSLYLSKLRCKQNIKNFLLERVRLWKRKKD